MWAPGCVITDQLRGSMPFLLVLIPIPYPFPYPISELFHALPDPLYHLDLDCHHSPAVIMYCPPVSSPSCPSLRLENCENKENKGFGTVHHQLLSKYQF